MNKWKTFYRSDRYLRLIYTSIAVVCVGVATAAVGVVLLAITLNLSEEKPTEDPYHTNHNAIHAMDQEKLDRIVHLLETLDTP